MTSGRDAGDTEKSRKIKKRPERPSRLKRKARRKMATNISLILHRFKDVWTSILILIFEDSPTFKNNGAQTYLGSHELLDLLEKLGKTPEEAEGILEKVIPTPSHYRLQLSLNGEQQNMHGEHSRNLGEPLPHAFAQYGP